MAKSLPTTARDGDLRVALDALEKAAGEKCWQDDQGYNDADMRAAQEARDAARKRVDDLVVALAPPPAQDPVPALGLPAGEVAGLRALSEKATRLQVQWSASRDKADWLAYLNAGHAFDDAAIKFVRTHVLAPPASAADGDGEPLTSTEAAALWEAEQKLSTAPPPVPPSRIAGLDREAVLLRTEQERDALSEELANAYRDLVACRRALAPTPGETPGQDAVEALAWVLLLHDHPSLPEHHIRRWVAEDLAVARDDPKRRGWGTDFERSQSRARTALTSLRSTQADTGGEAVPDGWKLVPVEPTPAMRKAGDMYTNCGGSCGNRAGADAYRAMLAAAPSPLATDGVKP